MESKYPAWQSVYYYFRKWRKGRIWDQVLEHLLGNDRELQRRDQEASSVVSDNQSVKKVFFILIDTGFDANKKDNGRKSYLAIDVLGLPLAYLR